MPVSKRDTLLTSVKTALANIKTTGGYNLNVGTITDALVNLESLHPGSFPVLFVVDDVETKQDDDVNGLDNTLNIIVTAAVKEANKAQDLQAETRKLMADIEKAVTEDRFRGGVAYNTVVRSIRTDRAAFRPYGIFDLTIEVKYKQEYGTP